uniref:Uncharacterized protein n=1 Tax=Palpitomonas bilix TaxID=652834 RepID=A0A7S3GGS1_9EUKA|mmetsp:Transcript_48491/g.125818  ORF Transcript_48491/g.125818 Transcript_48491/m.125818 type:complete len:190 (+) Transcript_48491:540-1109(+)
MNKAGAMLNVTGAAGRRFHRLLAENEEFFTVFKPAGCPTFRHPSSLSQAKRGGGEEESTEDFVRQMFPALAEKEYPLGFEVGIAHRLDSITSGQVSTSPVAQQCSAPFLPLPISLPYCASTRLLLLYTTNAVRVEGGGRKEARSTVASAPSIRVKASHQAILCCCPIWGGATAREGGRWGHSQLPDWVT